MHQHLLEGGDIEDIPGLLDDEDSRPLNWRGDPAALEKPSRRRMKKSWGKGRG